MDKFLFVVMFCCFVPVRPDSVVGGWHLICAADECRLKGYRSISEHNIYEGDIINEETESRNAIISPDRKWPNHTVPYVFHEDFSQDSIRRIEAAMRSLEETTCVRFIRYNGKVKSQYLKIVLGKGCHSTIGYSKDEDRIITLHEQACLGRLGRIQHELLHTLGLLHEQARPDRDQWVRIIWENIIEGKKYDFNKASENEFTTFGLDYDYGSVMHYSPFEFSKNKREPTLLPKINFDLDKIGQRKGATELDLKKINLMYSC